MKYVFNFLQIINWLIVCKENLQKINSKNMTKEEIITNLKIQKQKLLIVKDVLDRKIKLQGISSEFLKNFNNIKKSYGVED